MKKEVLTEDFLVSKYKQRDIHRVIPTEVKENSYLLERYKNYNLVTAIAKTEMFKERGLNRSAFYLLPLIGLEIDHFENKLLNVFIDNESYKLYCVCIDHVHDYVESVDEYLYSFKLDDVKEEYNEGVSYVFDMENYKDAVDLYLSSNVKDFPIEYKVRVTLANWLGKYSPIDVKEGKVIKKYLAAKTLFYDAELYGTKILWSMYTGEHEGNPLYEYYTNVLDVSLEPTSNLMETVIIENELITYLWKPEQAS